MTIAIDAREMVGAVAGKGRYVAELVKSLAALDRETTYYLYAKQPIELELPANFHKVLIGGLPGLRQLWLAWNVKQRGCDLLLAPTGYLPVIFSLVPTVVTVHDLAVFLVKEAKPALKTLLAERLLLGLATRKAKRIIAVSQSTKDDLVKHFHLPEIKISVTLLGYDKTAYTPKLDNQPTRQLENYLLFVGTLEPRKNIEGLLRAYAKLPAELQTQYPLWIVGKKGWYYDSIFATVHELRLESAVNFLGRVSDSQLPKLYRQAKLFLFPSFYEGFGLPPLEAMACGTPVISSNLSSLPEVVGQGGLLVDPHDTDQLPAAIEKLLTDESLYAQKAEAALKQAALFSWQKTAQQTLALFRQIAQKT